MVTLTVTLMSGHSLWHLSVVEGDPSNFEELAGSSLQQLEALLQQAVPGLQKQEKITLHKKSAINFTTAALRHDCKHECDWLRTFKQQILYQVMLS
jgi:hypothetical protein